MIFVTEKSFSALIKFQHEGLWAKLHFKCCRRHLFDYKIINRVNTIVKNVF